MFNNARSIRNGARKTPRRRCQEHVCKRTTSLPTVFQRTRNGWGNGPPGQSVPAHGQPSRSLAARAFASCSPGQLRRQRRDRRRCDPSPAEAAPGPATMGTCGMAPRHISTAASPPHHKTPAPPHHCNAVHNIIASTMHSVLTRGSGRRRGRYQGGWREAAGGAFDIRLQKRLEGRDFVLDAFHGVETVDGNQQSCVLRQPCLDHGDGLLDLRRRPVVRWHQACATQHGCDPGKTPWCLRDQIPLTRTRPCLAIALCPPTIRPTTTHRGQ